MKRRWLVAAAILAVAGVAVWLSLAAAQDAPRAAATPSQSSPAGEGREPDSEPEPTGAVAGSDATCSVEYAVRDTWPDGFTVDITVRNLGEPREGWELAWRFDGGERIEDLWNAVLVDGASGPDVVVRDAGHNATITTGGEVTLGFVGAGPSTVMPAEFLLDGAVCTPSPTGEVDAGSPVDDEHATEGMAAFYRHDVSRASSAADAATGAEKRLLEKISTTPQAYWVTDPSPEVAAEAVRDYTTKAQADGGIGLLALYAVPGRDCGQHSSGGVRESAYARWIDAVADAVVGEPWIVLEPDALAMLGDCEGQGDRVGYLQYAAKALTDAGARVYLDVGHSGWLSADEAAERLRLVGVENVAGFALNVSNYQTTSDSVAYGERIAELTGGARYVIDTSRNGNGSDGTWCNPPGRALGERPRLVDDGTHLDALLWIKLPGESDGTCNGGPEAGQWFNEQALELARRASW